MNRQTLDLGFILRQFPNAGFSVDGLDGRLHLQRFVYLIQAFDIYLGYGFSWNIRGPYCSTLMLKAFELQEIYAEIPENGIRFMHSNTMRRFGRFREFVSGHEADAEFLEVAVMLHYLKSAKGLEGDVAVQALADGSAGRLPAGTCRKVQRRMRKWGL